MTTRLTPLFALQNRSWIEWVTLLVSLTVLGGYIVWSLANERDGVESRERERLSTQARIIDVHIAQQLDAIRRVLISLRQDLPYWQRQAGGMSRANLRLKAFSEALIGVRTLGILDANGTLVATNRESLISRNFRERAYFQNARQNPDPNILHVSAPFTAVTGKWVIMLSMSILSEQGEFAGLVVASLDPERFHATLESVIYTADMWSAIAHGDGLQFMMVPERTGQAGINLAQPGSFFSRHMESGNTQNVLTGIVYSTGENRMMALRTIQPPQLLMDKPLVIAVGRDLRTIFSRWQKDALFHSALLLLLAFTSSYGLYRLQRAQRAAERNAASAAAAIHKKNSELEALNEQLRSLALVDGLTGVANRRRFDEVIDNEWRRCRRDQVPLALLMIDIDHFKDFNDHYGHQAGDECLKKIARVLKEGFGRGTDLVARYGGEEFVGLMPETDLAGAEAKAELLRASVEGLNIPHQHSTAAACVTISIGVTSSMPGDDNVSHSLITEADEGLYCAKHRGRNRVCTAPSVNRAQDTDFSTL